MKFVQELFERAWHLVGDVRLAAAVCPPDRPEESEGRLAERVAARRRDHLSVVIGKKYGKD